MDRMRTGLATALAVWMLAAGGQVRSAEVSESSLNDIRNRLRSEAGVCEVSTKDEDLPLLTVTALPGDTWERIAADLTGGTDAVAMMRKIQPEPKPGKKFYIPRAILLPSLSDPELETIHFGRPYPTLWTLTRLVTGLEQAELGRAVRNIQRLNAILDPGRLPKGARILVPRSLLADSDKGDAGATAGAFKAETVGKNEPKAAVRDDYRVTDVRGLERHSGRFPARLRHALTEKELREMQAARGEVSLVVIHTTEHQGSTFENTASYIQRKRLANYLVGPDGGIYEIVPERYRAYGCGDSLWEGRYTVDLEAINIEVFANSAPGEHQNGISEDQYNGLKALLADIRSRRPRIHEARIVTHRMVALNYKTGMRSRKGDPYDFDWTKVGLPDNSLAIDQDVLLGRAKLCTDERFADRVTPGQTAAAKMATKL